MTLYSIRYEGCGHRTIVDKQHLESPPESEFDMRTATKRDKYLCWSCLREEKGACSETPYHAVASARELNPLETKIFVTNRVRKELL